MSNSRAAIHVCSQLDANGYEAYLVGGCVRDTLIGISPKDYDIVTNANPEQINSVFPHAFSTGHFLVSRVKYEGDEVEIAQYREDTYPDAGSSKPASVKAVLTLQEDLYRRDFTVNAIAMNIRGDIIDPFNGAKDVDNGVIRMIRDKAFVEDPVRILRAFKFASRYNWIIEDNTLSSIKENAYKLRQVPYERLQKEFLSILYSDYAGPTLDQMGRVGVIKYVLPELAHTVECRQNPAWHDKDVWGHICDVIQLVPSQDHIVRLAALTHDIAKGTEGIREVSDSGVPMDRGHEKAGVEPTGIILSRLGIPKVDHGVVKFLVEHHGLRFGNTDKSVRKWLTNKIPERVAGWDMFTPILDKLEVLCVADAKAHTADHVQDLLDNHTSLINAVRSQAGIFPLGRRDLPFTGDKMVKMGMQQEQVGEAIKEAIEWMRQHGNDKWEAFWRKIENKYCS